MIFILKMFKRNVYMDIRYLFMYASPIWSPNASSSLVQKLHIFQNSDLHVVSGFPGAFYPDTENYTY